MRCPSCDHACRFVSPTGPQPSPVMFIGEKPGREEANRGLVFQGDSGREMDGLYLPLAGLDREDVRITNSVKCRLGDSNDKPTPEQVRNCSMHHLPEEIRRGRPEVIVLLGSTACSLVPGIELDKDHGMPVRVESGAVECFGDWSGWVWPSYHPAAALHDTGMMVPLIDDFERFRKWRRGKWTPPVPVTQEPDYQLVTTVNEFTAYVDCMDAVLTNATDTENDGPRPWSLQWSHTPGTARMILYEHRNLVTTFEEWMRECSSDWVFQNANHDIDVYEAMGIRFDGKEFRDTMQEAYQLGNLPQGLKSLSWRLLGIRMRSWEDVVLPHSREKMIAWLMDKWLDSEHYRTAHDTFYARPKKPTHKKLPDIPVWNEDRTLIVGSREWKPTDMERALKRILSHSHKPEYDLWDKVAEVEGLGGWPIKSIAHVPMDDAVVYACQDADVTGQVAVELERLRGEIVAGEWNVPEGDWDQ